MQDRRGAGDSERVVLEGPIEEGRRSFLKALGLGGAAALASCSRLPVEEAIPLLVAPEQITPGVPSYYASTCQACPASCGLVATVREGRPVKLEGDPQHPLSAGGLCALGQGELRGLYDPDRDQRPTIGANGVAWGKLDEHVTERLEAVTAAGRRVIVLAPTIVSPTARAAIAAFLERYDGELVELDIAPGSPAALADAYEVIDGRRLVPAYDLAAVDVWVSLASDLLGAGPEPVAHTRAWAARRAAAAERGLMRHVQIEASVSLTGANADERWRHTARERRAIALGLARAIAEHRGGAEAQAVATALGDLEPPVADPARLERLVSELVTGGRHALLTSSADDRAEQLAVAIANRLLGAEGVTLDVARPALVRRGQPAAARRALDELLGGEAGALVSLLADPVGQLPEGAALGEAIAGLELAVAIDDRPTATTRACGVVAPAHHSLERWADAEPRPGLLTLAQPLIRPLFDTREPYESFLRWSGSGDADWRQHLERSWRRRAPAATGSWADLWHRTVQTAGHAAATAISAPPPAGEATAPAVALRAALAEATGSGTEGDEIELIAEVGIRDGSRAHVPWLRELPDPLTRCAWTACARISPERAHALGVDDGDHIEVATETGQVEMPVRITPGQDPRVIALPVGYGLTAGDPATWNAYRLRSWRDGRLADAGVTATVRRRRGHTQLPLMQTESSAHDRPIVHQLASLDDKVQGPHIPDADMWHAPPPSSPHWEMVINLDACTGCSACVVACQAENNIPVVGPEGVAQHRDMHWLRLDRYHVGDEANPDVLFEPMLCAHCDDAPCETVCPVLATVHSEDGLNQQVYNRCVGTRYCANNCPYKVRRFNWFDYAASNPVERMVLNPDVVVRSRGVMEKCSFCVQRIQASRIDARKQGADSYTATTACQQSCPAGAIVFGDANDSAGEVAELKARNNAFQVLAELGVRPSITYLARLRNRADLAGEDGAHGDDAHGHNDHGEES